MKPTGGGAPTASSRHSIGGLSATSADEFFQTGSVEIDLRTAGARLVAKSRAFVQAQHLPLNQVQLDADAIEFVAHRARHPFERAFATAPFLVTNNLSPLLPHS